VEFTPTQADIRLYLSSDPAHRGTVMYLLPAAETSCPTSISFADSWDKFGGAYLFVATAPSDQKEFAEAARGFLEDPRNAGARFAWLEPEAGDLATGTAIAVSPTGSGWATSRPIAFELRNFGLTIAAGTQVAPAEPGFSFSFTPPGAGGLQFTAGWGGATAGTVTGAMTLPLAGPLAGCLQMPLELALPDLDTLDVGLRWFYPAEKEAASGEPFFLASLRCPLLAAGATLYPNLDPLQPLELKRTFLAFNQADLEQQQSEPAPAVESYLRATTGDVLSLQPLAAKAIGSRTAAAQRFASLVFAANPGASTAAASDPFYLVPHGDFELKSKRSGKFTLMGGLSGVEYFEPTGAAAPATVSFVAGKPAFEKGFFPGEPPGTTQLEPADVPTTSYASVTEQKEGVGYFAQPDQSVLYNYGDLPKSGAKPIVPLVAQPVHVTTLSSGPEQAPLFPLLPYAGTEGQLREPFAQLESQVVNPKRRKEIAAKAEAPAAAPASRAGVGGGPSSAHSATPQGLLAEFGPTPGKWRGITLAQMQAPAKQLEFKEVDNELLAAFQSNKMFLVASKPAAIAPYLQPDFDRITIGTADNAWTFDLGTEHWAEYQTVLIVKFSDQSIEQLAKNTAAWAAATTFNDDPAAVSEQIDKAIENAATEGEDLSTFHEAMTDPTWNGIIALNVRAPLAGLPKELAGLAAGIDPGHFFAHHVAVKASKIKIAAGGELEIENSSIFGLIHYEGSEPDSLGAPYAFQVKQLKVLFLNSAVASFSSRIDLQANALFGEPAELQGGSHNIVELLGVYQRHPSVDGTPQGSYVFETADRSTFAMKSAVLDAVVLSKGQFVTITEDSNAHFTDSKFVFWGTVDFRQLEADVFSFGREEGATEPAGLSFGNLAIRMTFEPQAAAIAPAFEFDASQLSLDLATSNARKDGLFAHFPLTLSGMKQMNGTTPTELGYMGLDTVLSQSSLSYPSFSLDFDLDLGSAGAMAAGAGFVAGLTVAWSPGNPEAYSVFTGLKLPGSSGSKRQISIEGLFNITFKAMELLTPAPGSYVLVLYGIGFKFFSLTFPPSGQVNFTLFGDPNQGGKSSALGWYAAYAKDAPQGGKSASLATAAPARPALPEGDR
jgi:hypothetical protein